MSKQFDKKPIETQYKGILFRSKMESKTAVFLDFLGIDWKYEHEAYALNHGGVNYLPDFYIPHQDRLFECFIEVKGVYPNADEIEKAVLLCRETRRDVIVLYDFPFIDENKVIQPHLVAFTFDKNTMTVIRLETAPYSVYQGSDDCFCSFKDKVMLANRLHFGSVAPCIGAYNAARSYRFEEYRQKKERAKSKNAKVTGRFINIPLLNMQVNHV